MATHPFYSSGNPSTPGMPPVISSAQRMALDNILRRELRVSDPNDSMQVAQALLTRYKDNPRAQAISQEAKGLPLSVQLPSMVPQAAATSSDAELQQAKGDVERDLLELTTNSLLKDITPELQGWAQAVRSAMQQGAVAARFALDPHQRDKTFAIRRQLGDYARVARLVGALTPELNQTYRSFAKSLDEVAGVLLVLMGESLANVGFSGGRFLLQTPFTELQARRDAAIYALRNLTGATQQAYGPNDWPRGLDAYRSLYRLLEDQGQGDLRSLLVEHELARIMDELIQRAANGAADGLRALGSTARLDLDRFYRLAILGHRLVSPEAPPLTAFLEALQLFADAFEGAGGFRLMRIARPPILFYGLYGIRGPENADQRLLRLILERGSLAEAADCFAQCGCGVEAVICQALLDKILYDVDRAIDLYALGKDDFGRPERRAAAYAYLIEFVSNDYRLPARPGEAARSCAQLTHGVFPTGTLQRISEEMTPDLRLSNPEVADVALALRAFSIDVVGLLQIQEPGSASVAALNAEIAAFDGDIGFDAVTSRLDANLTVEVTDLTDLYRLAQAGQARLEALEFVAVPDTPINVRQFLDLLAQELCIQKDLESRWRDLVRTMAPNCLGTEEVLEQIIGAIDSAIDRVSGIECPPIVPSIPPHYETSLDSIVDDVDRVGRGRPNRAL